MLCFYYFIGKHAVDEGEGMRYLVNVLNLQAEMYKLMGLWSLSLGIYLDCADITTSLLGFSDSISALSWNSVTNCLRKMGLENLSLFYLETLCRDIELFTLKKMKVEVVDNIRQNNK